MVELSDVIIQVLDARDPLSCRSPEVERFVRRMNPDKRMILLLNKIDLVPKDNVLAWLNYFREELPTVAFKCATRAAEQVGARSANFTCRATRWRRRLSRRRQRFGDAQELRAQ